MGEESYFDLFDFKRNGPQPPPHMKQLTFGIILRNYETVGFLIDDALKAKGIELICPAFHGVKRAQLTSKEVHDTHRIAEARIHVEPAFGRMKYFKILYGMISLSKKPVVERIFTVCAFLTNFQNPVLKSS